MSSRCQLTFAIAIAVIASPLVGVTQEKATVQGERTLNRDLTPERKGADHAHLRFEKVIAVATAPTS